MEPYGGEEADTGPWCLVWTLHVLAPQPSWRCSKHLEHWGAPGEVVGFSTSLEGATGCRGAPGQLRGGVGGRPSGSEEALHRGAYLPLVLLQARRGPFGEFYKEKQMEHNWGSVGSCLRLKGLALAVSHLVRCGIDLVRGLYLGGKLSLLGR